ncbi:hypothetical protein [Entomohabitans teleogrylli]|uniref:hypothetical protein n=1 Tax=Entomohabitans teleogrylli TaxID=1384589 RepID=UPI000AC62546|nr:hypothetical protein [Entomohabitans teleogrylli]
MWRIIIAILIVLTSVALLMAALRVVVFPRFHEVAAIMFIVTGVAAAGRHRRLIPYAAETCLAVAGGIVVFVLLAILAPREGHRQYTSPQGTRSVVLEFDHASRPALYLRRWIFMTPVALPPFRGAMEIIPYSVYWLSEDELLLTEKISGKFITIRLDN